MMGQNEQPEIGAFPVCVWSCHESLGLCQAFQNNCCTHMLDNSFQVNGFIFMGMNFAVFILLSFSMGVYS